MKKLEGQTAEFASSLVHHLLNQSLSSLDFCILWQEMVSEHPEFRAVDDHISKFLSSADLTALDEALALLPEPIHESPQKLKIRAPLVAGGWNVTSVRVREVSRAEFCCQTCGWTIVLSQEHEANTEMRLPFDNVLCPLCHP